MSAWTVRYIVLNENTLAYWDPDRPHVAGVLHGSVLKGGHDWKNGPVWLTLTDKVRDATPADFNEYRCNVPPDFLESRRDSVIEWDSSAQVFTEKKHDQT